MNEENYYEIKEIEIEEINDKTKLKPPIPPYVREYPLDLTPKPRKKQKRTLFEQIE